MAKNKGYTPPTPAEQRALRDQKVAAQVDHVEGAKRREMAMVANLGKFTDECRWFMANKVWLVLGYETLVAWWADRIAPLVDGMGLTAGPELGQLAIEAIQEEEASLPAAQRHSKKALTAMVGLSDWKARARQDHRQRRSTTNVDLEGGSKVLDDVEFVETRESAVGEPPTGAGSPTDGGEGEPDLPVDPPASVPAPVGAGGGADVTPAPLVHLQSEFRPDARSQPPTCFVTGADRPQEYLSEITCPACLEWLAGDGTDFAARWLRGGRLKADDPTQDPPAGADPTPGALVADQPGLEDSSSGSETDEAPAGIDDVFTEDSAIATDRPGADHLDPHLGEARAGADLLAAGATPPPEDAGVRRGGDEVEGGSLPPEELSSTDPADVVEVFTEWADWVDGYDSEALGPLFTDEQLGKLHTAVDDLAQFVGSLERWRTNT
jgi:hypothetical protein